MNSFSFLTSLMAAAFLLLSCGPQNYDNVDGPASQDVVVPGIPLQKARGPQTALSAGDLIKLKYPGAPEFNQTQKIRRNNRVSLPMIGDVLAGGKSLKQFQSELASRYSKHLQNPNVVVTVELASAAVYVSGYVKNPTKISLDRPMTALEAIMEAGGFNKYGSPKRVSVVRNVNGNYQRYKLNLDAALQGLAKPFPLKPNDVINVR